MRRECERKLVGRMLGRITVAPGSARQLVGECREWSSLRGQRVRALERHGKWLLMRLHSGVTVAIHPRMSGRLLVCNPTELARLAPHARVVMRLDNGRLAVLNDARRFGRVLQLPVGTNQPQRTGPDAMKISRASFAAALTSTSRSVKAALLDQALLAGVGNIYADEMLWMAQVHPGGRANALTNAQAGELHKAMGRVLRGAIVRSGTSFDAGYEGGRNQHHLNAYGRAGKPCKRCGSPLAILKIASRTTVMCAKCQRDPVQQRGRKKAVPSASTRSQSHPSLESASRGRSRRVSRAKSQAPTRVDGQ